MKKLALLAVAVSLVFIPLGAMAQEENAAQAAAEAEAKNKVLEAAQEFTKDFDKMSTRHFSVLYGNYNLVKVVETVRDDVEKAVEACGKANPDLEEPIETRFDAWNDAVKPILEEADANVNNMILAQDYALPRDIKKFLKMIDDEREEQAERVKKVPVTSAEACETLMKKMDGSQEKMVNLLQMTLVSLPTVMNADDEKVKAEAQAKAEEEAAKAAAEEEARKIEAEEEAAKAEEEAQEEL